MCDPVSLGIAAVSAAVGTVSSVQGANASVRAANANAQTATYQAEDRREAAEIEVAKSFENYKRHAGNTRAQIAGSGFSSGSFSDVLADDSAEAAVERWSTRYTAEKEAFYLERQADAELQAASDARAAGRIGVATSFANAAQAGFSNYNKSVKLSTPFSLR